MFDERDELANEREMGMTEADYEEMSTIFEAMDAYEEYVAYFSLVCPDSVPMSFKDWLVAV